jgi:mono/diheme cytochrome c family protein
VPWTALSFILQTILASDCLTRTYWATETTVTKTAMKPTVTLVAALLLTASLGLAEAACGSEPFEAFLKMHCVRCHGPQKEEGDVRIDRLSRDFKAGADSHHWAEVLENVNSGDMPPETEPRPTQAEIAAFVTNLDFLVKEGRSARMAARPAVSHYRLSRKEYQNTVYDLLGVRYDPAKPGELNEDTLWHGFERIGSQLSLSPSHMDRYYRAAGIVLDRAFPSSSVAEARNVRKTAAELRYGGGKSQQEALDRFGIKRPLRYLLFPGTVRNALSPNWFGKSGPEHSGLYKLRLQASGIRPPGGQPAHLSIGKRTGEQTVDGLVEFDITAPEDSPQVYEFEVFLEMPANLDFCVVATDVVDRRSGGALRGALGSGSYIFTHSSETSLLNPNAPQMFDGKGNGLFSTVILDWIEWEGPLVSEQEKARRTDLFPPDDATPEAVAEHLQRFAERAWRRPVKKEELEDYLHAYQSEREAGEKSADAYRLALQGVLTSRHFIYLVEGDTAAREQLTDSELASRLSYFLWSSMPDDGLFKAAQSGSLNGDGLQNEVHRMLADGKASRFVDDFARQWLQLHRVGMFPPDKKLYPGYDDWLETSMRSEVIEYFREIFAKNLPIDTFIDSDWTMANARLCDFYGLPEPKTDGFQRVSLKPEDHRGGLLTMGAVLGLTSDGTRHRPVHRGVWLSEAILGKTPPSPPANVPAIEPNPPENPKATLREKIEMHRNDANCAACHAKIDPLGLAWDNYDAIGQWRTREKVPAGVGEDPLINPAGLMPDGRAFKDATEFKQRLLEDRDKVARAFIEQLCTYGLRRVLSVDDQDELKTIQEEAKKNDYRVRDIVRAVALSELMRKR